MQLKVLVIAGALIASSIFPATAADHTLNVSTALTMDDPLFKGLESFRDAVAQRTGNKVEIKLFPNSQLGSDEDVIEQARAGAPVALVVDGGRIASYEKTFGVLSAPYIAPDYEGIRKVVTSPLFEGWAKKLHDSSGLQILSFNWSQGERHVMANKFATKPADLAGVRMRTPGAPVWIETVRAMGATPTPMPYSEVYSGLQQRVIDALEVQMTAAYGSKLHEVAKNVTKTHHIHLITGLIASASWFDSLPPDLQKILREEALKAGDVASYGTRDATKQIEEKMKAAGVTFQEIDVTAFRDATASVYDKLGYGDVRKQIEDILKN